MKHAKKIIVSKFLTMKATILDTHGSWKVRYSYLGFFVTSTATMKKNMFCLQREGKHKNWFKKDSAKIFLNKMIFFLFR